MHPHRAMAIFILNKTSRLETKSQKRVESAMKISQSKNIPLVGECHQCCDSRPWRKPGNCGALAVVSRRSIVLPNP